jgi:CheY-like chemotaxis protein
MNSKVTRFLLADDDSDDREMFSEALAALDPNIVCHGCEDGRQALKHLSPLKSEQPSIIFIDINMPVMNGWDLLKNLKSTQDFVHIPVIIYSTSSRHTDRKIAQDLGATCFVTKPDSFKQVKGMLEVVLTHLNNNQVSEMCGQIHRRLKL